MLSRDFISAEFGSICSVFTNTTVFYFLASTNDCEPGNFYDRFYKACSQCYSGTYQDEYGQTGCKDCEPGTYAANYGQEYCTPCEAGNSQDNV